LSQRADDQISRRDQHRLDATRPLILERYPNGLRIHLLQPMRCDRRPADVLAQLLQCRPRLRAYCGIGVQRIAVASTAVPAMRLDLRHAFAELHTLRLAGILAHGLVAEHRVAQ